MTPNEDILDSEKSDKEDDKMEAKNPAQPDVDHATEEADQPYRPNKKTAEEDTLRLSLSGKQPRTYLYIMLVLLQEWVKKQLVYKNGG